MPRKPRIIVANYPHHVIVRGNNRASIFWDDEDRNYFKGCVKLAKEKTRSKIYSYCLMTNHVHMLVEPSYEQGIAEMLQSIGRRYVRYINEKYQRSGTLWEGRYKSSLVGNDEYLLMCIRYIELNPTRAGIVKSPEEYPWSSYKKMAEGSFDALASESVAYQNFGKTTDERKLNYKKWILQDVPESELEQIRKITQKNGVLGTSDFKVRISHFLERDVVLKPRGRPKKSL